MEPKPCWGRRQVMCSYMQCEKCYNEGSTGWCGNTEGELRIRLEKCQKTSQRSRYWVLKDEQKWMTGWQIVHLTEKSCKSSLFAVIRVSASRISFTPSYILLLMCEVLQNQISSSVRTVYKLRGNRLFETLRDLPMNKVQKDFLFKTTKNTNHWGKEW